MSSLSAPPDVGALWLQTLQRAVGRAAHDVKDALNGVSVNLEVIRGRAARPELAVSAVAVFADAASQQLERLSALVDAVLALAREDRTPVDLTALLRRLCTVCSASASASDPPVTFEEDRAAGDVRTPVPRDVARLVLATTLLDAVGSATAERADVRCRVTRDGEEPVVRISAGGRGVAVADGIAEIARGAGIRISEHSEDTHFTFPRP